MSLVYFVGIPIPNPLHNQIIGFREKYRQIAFLQTEPHITLIPPTNISGENDIPVKSLQLVAGKFDPFHISSEGVDHFNQRVIFLKAASEDLNNLYQEIKRKLRLANDRNFHPHISLVNFRNKQNPSLAKIIQRDASDIFSVNRFLAKHIRVYVRDQSQSYKLFLDIELQKLSILS